ncbi:Aste57867_2165 [Aphanomyces stellatus]|uniref:Aste57867_2165 protein n=1 Tax=Aphanomyces stellatus TaxID=120398 RepID=A0A485K7L5_9STRA|nr:hypothetical protein As57867_002160 [Aphanomyces stellatus]VFT79368.1 Aste57867_2165 [Aphanomyces stellatus]
MTTKPSAASPMIISQPKFPLPHGTIALSQCVLDIHLVASKLTAWMSPSSGASAWRQLLLSGQSVAVYYGSKRMADFNSTEYTLENSHGWTYMLKSKKGAVKLIFRVASASRMRTFLEAWAASVASKHWVRPQLSVWQRMVGVARAVVEASTNPSQSTTLVVACSNVTRRHVADYMASLQTTFALTGLCATVDDLYDQLLDSEAAYVASVAMDELPGVARFAHTVHLQHPVAYARYTVQHCHGLHPGKSLRTLFSACANCNQPLARHESYRLHLRGRTIQCPSCMYYLNLNMYRLKWLVTNHPTVSFPAPARALSSTHSSATTTHTRTIFLPPLPRDGQLDTFRQQLDQIVQAAASGGGVAATWLAHVHEAIAPAFETALGHFPIDLVRAMHSHVDFVWKMGPHVDYWTHMTVVDAAICRYERFMTLCRHEMQRLTRRGSRPRLLLAPTLDIVLVWYAQMVESPATYAAFCNQHVGRLVDVASSLLRGDAAYANTFLQWSKVFDEPYSSYPPSFRAYVTTKETPTLLHVWHLEKKWLRYVWLPSSDCRYVGVDEAFPADQVHRVGADDGDTDVFLSVLGTPATDGRVKVRFPWERTAGLGAVGALVATAMATTAA